MVELRRWLLNSSSRASLAGAFLLAATAGCQSTRDYAASVDASSQWSASTVIDAEPTPYVEQIKPTPVAPYEETPDELAAEKEPTDASTPLVVPGPEALSAPQSPAAAPPAESESAGKPTRRRKSQRAETVTVDDVAPAPEVAGPEDLSATKAREEADSLLPTDLFPDDLPVTSEPGSTVRAERPRPQDTAAASTQEEASSSNGEGLDALPMPEPADADLTASPAPLTEPETASERAPVDTEALPARTTEELIPGLPVDSDLSPVLPQVDETPARSSETTTPLTPDEPVDDTEAISPSASLRPLFPEVQPSQTLARVDRPSTPTTPRQPAVTSDRKLLVDLPEPLPVTPASSKATDRDGSSVVSADTADRVQIIATLDSEATGIAFDGHGNLLVTSDEGLSRISPTGTRQDFAAIDSPRGFAPLPDGSFAVCDVRQRALLKVDRTGSPIEFLAQRSDGHFLRAPSFVAVDAAGGVYFTDPGYARITAPTGRLHYISADGEVNLVSQRLAYPQGVALSADGTTLFVVECQNQRIVQFEVLSPGRVGPSGEFARLVPKTAGDSDDFATDLTVDRDGRVFVARHGMQRVDVLNADGQMSRSIAVPDVLASSVALSEDENSLFVAGAAANAQWSGLVVRVPVSDRN